MTIQHFERTGRLRRGLYLGAALAAASVLAQPAAAKEVGYTISAMPLAEALKEFGTQSGVSIVFSDVVAAGMTTPGLSGRYEVDDALRMLLKNTGLGFERIDSKTFVVSKANSRSSAPKNETAAAAATAPTRAEVAPTDSDVDIEYILVTAQKRNQRLLDVPISITAFNSKTLEQVAPQRLNDLQYMIPNVISVVSFDHSAGAYSIRGVAGGSSGNIGREAAAAVSVDGVYIGRTAAFNQDLIDIERIEVLRGPQGTLQGKNTMSGAINIITKKPPEEFEGRVQANVGNLGLLQGNASVGGPMGDNGLYAKATVFGIQDNGYVENIFNGQNLNNEGAYGARVHFRYAPDDQLEINLTGDLMRERHARYNFEPLRSTQAAINIAPNLDEVNFNQHIDVDRDVDGVALSANYAFDNGLTLDSISAWRHLYGYVLADSDATSRDSIVGINEEDQSQFSQEFRLSTGKREFYDIVTGVYYFHQNVDGFASSETRPQFPFGLIGTLTQRGGVKTDSYAAFAHGIFDIAERLKLDAGIRYTHEDKDFRFDQNRIPLFPFPAITGFVDSLSEGGFAPTVGLTYAVDPDVNIYAKYARGFKSGGFNFAAVTNAQLSFGSERVDSYEIGVKAAVADQRVQINLAGFYMDYSDQQVTLLLGVGGSGGTIIANAANSTSKGFEAELLLRPVDKLDITAGLGYTKAKFDQFFDGRTNYSGNRLQQAPRVNGNIAATYTAELGGPGSLVFRAEYAYQDDYFLDAANATLLPSRDIVNARAGYVAPDGKWSLYLWSRNLFDERVPENFGGDALGIVLGSAYNKPRTFGAELTYNF